MKVLALFGKQVHHRVKGDGEASTASQHQQQEGERPHSILATHHGCYHIQGNVFLRGHLPFQLTRRDTACCQPFRAELFVLFVDLNRTCLCSSDVSFP